MKTKQKKEWFGREKSRDELHDDSKIWLSEINFALDEMKFLENLIRSKYANLIYAGLEDRVPRMTSQLSESKQWAAQLRKTIREHENLLDELIRTNSVTSNTNYIETHQQLDVEVYNFMNAYRGLKRNIFHLVEKVISKKELQS